MKNFVTYISLSLLASAASLNAFGSFNIENAERPKIEEKKVKLRRKLNEVVGEERDFAERKLQLLETIYPNAAGNNNNGALKINEYKALKKEELIWKKGNGKFVPRFDFENLSIEVNGNNVHILLRISSTLEDQEAPLCLKQGQGILWNNGKLEVVENARFLTIKDDKKRVDFEIYRSDDILQVQRAVGVKYFGLVLHAEKGLVRFPGQYEELEQVAIKANTFHNCGSFRTKSFQFLGDVLENNGDLCSQLPLVLSKPCVTVNNNCVIQSPEIIAESMKYSGPPVLPLRDVEFIVEQPVGKAPPPPTSGPKQTVVQKKKGKSANKAGLIKVPIGRPLPPAPLTKDGLIKANHSDTDLFFRQSMQNLRQQSGYNDEPNSDDDGDDSEEIIKTKPTKLVNASFKEKVKVARDLVDAKRQELSDAFKIATKEKKPGDNYYNSNIDNAIQNVTKIQAEIKVLIEDEKKLLREAMIDCDQRITDLTKKPTDFPNRRKKEIGRILDEKSAYERLLKSIDDREKDENKTYEERQAEATATKSQTDALIRKARQQFSSGSEDEENDSDW